MQPLPINLKSVSISVGQSQGSLAVRETNSLGMNTTSFPSFNNFTIGPANIGICDGTPLPARRQTLSDRCDIH
jgi:hypothetical protein